MNPSEGHRSAERQPCSAVVRSENLLSCNLSCEAIIVPATNLEMRRPQDV
jgi:hypothetical protein